ncbi:RHS repeat-associated core domain-containing protein, partial [Pseudomonas sp. Root562]|uniref:RHS repeat-associated core domain-containing protein n=1 Tax=Pseudomonas sp. Root562 TaxID=1736561 RepID=UPI0012E34EE9
TEIQGELHRSIVQYDDQLLAQQARQGDDRDTTLLNTDLQRSVLHRLKASQPLHPNVYTAYGHHAQSGLPCLLGFNGERPEPVTGHYLLGNGYRAFNPVLMRFNSPDSWSPFGKGGINPYAYCLGDPINRYDQDGHLSLSFVIGARIWKNRAKATIAKRAVEAEEVAATQTIRLHGTDYSLKKDVLPLEAVKARDKINYLYKLSSDEVYHNRKYLDDLSSARRQSELVEKMTGIPASQNDRLKLLNYIKKPDKRGFTFSYFKLIDAAYGKFDPATSPSNRPSPDSAKLYYNEIQALKNYNGFDFRAKADRIRDENFKIKR